MASIESIKFVTCIYDIGRGAEDGRSLDQYIKWLSKTLIIFPETYVFYEDDDIRLSAGEGGIWIKLPFKKFELADQIVEIEEICKKMSKISDDLTFRLPSYAILQFQKFNLLHRVSNLDRESTGLFWIDAGISRFISEDLSLGNLESLRKGISANQLFDKSVFEVDFKSNVTFAGRLKRAKIGTCRRIFSGTAFYLVRDDIPQYARLIAELAKEWIRDQKWDNEQVALSNLFASKAITPKILPQKNTTGTTARFFLGLEKSRPIAINSFIYKVLQR